ncbi:hypothetical protein [Pseudonocardia sp. T1-2H]|uniref:hypothetical protein n=1 Tax=Pseudonocardia sp. T1-2H TaxID=3128899 RepID=UPI0031011404
MSVVDSAFSSGMAPVNTALPIIDGLNRKPSSLNQSTTARLNRGVVPASRWCATSR